MGKLIVAAALALVAGLFIGGLGPRAELAQARKELDAARAAASRGGGASVLPFALGIGGLAAAGRQARERPAPSVPPPPPRFQAPPGHPAPSGQPPGEQAPGVAEPAEPVSGALGGPEAFAAARAAAALRAAQYREAFFEQARLSPQAQAAVTTTIAEMNRELGKAAEELTAELGQRARLGPREMADVGARVLDIYRRADDRFKASLDEPGRAAAEKTEFDLLTQIDLGAVEGLAERIGRMQSSPERQEP